MTLQQLLLTRGGRDEGTIYLAQPWAFDADAVFVSPAPKTTEPVFRDGRSYDYFLEGFIARDFLEDLGVQTGEVGRDACERLIRYAIDDA